MSADTTTTPTLPTPTTPAIELPEHVDDRPPLAGRVWSALWPRVAAIVLVIAVWQLVVWSGWKPEFALAGPGAAFSDLWHRMTDGTLWTSLETTLRRAVVGYAVAIVIGSALGLAVSRWRGLRLAIGSLISGMQTMPSIAWFPLAILLFQLSESAITFVIVLGAAPSIANGIISGIDYVPPSYLRAGRMLGAKGIDRYRYVVIPAALPAYVAGLSQGWAFAWRSLMAGELLVTIAYHSSLGADLNNARQNSDSPGLLAMMIVILVVGMVINGLFSLANSQMRTRRGLAET